MKLIAGIEGVNSIVVDPAKKTVTVIGEADPFEIIRKVRKFRRCAEIVTIGPAKEEKKEPKPELPSTCQKCDAWFIIREEDYGHGYCSIL
ncbi:hypothetical protein QJS04_geneDACA002733 [Acorus gramineus]|uniref:HMA domain-containing protein n=1 Tax=Acorus gramineus TaxID=55184 RepID=A0AAV9BSQ6_ACOGR|nr:hypothetical protein QJS04_geneDACA023152 [Acorus gramineus]KAK1280585.1 hypothetical protein QJS04_geneDACA002733 [Acorus gramineus]